MARHKMAGADLDQRCHLRQIIQSADRAGNIARQQLAPIVAARRIGHRHGRQQAARVGVLRILEHCAAWTNLDNLAQIHHRHPVADTFYHRHVV